LRALRLRGALAARALVLRLSGLELVETKGGKQLLRLVIRILLGRTKIESR
jgi:hypothetical protein